MCRSQVGNIKEGRQGSEPTRRTSPLVKPDWFVLGADRSAKRHGEPVDSHHVSGKTALLSSENVSGASMIYSVLRHPLC